MIRRHGQPHSWRAASLDLGASQCRVHDDVPTEGPGLSLKEYFINTVFRCSLNDNGRLFLMETP